MKPYETLEMLEKNTRPTEIPRWFQVRADGLHRAAARGDAEAGDSTGKEGIWSPDSIAKNEDLGKSVWKITIEIVDLPSYKMVLSHDLYLVGGDWNMAGL